MDTHSSLQPASARPHSHTHPPLHVQELDPSPTTSPRSLATIHAPNLPEDGNGKATEDCRSAGNLDSSFEASDATSYQSDFDSGFADDDADLDDAASNGAPSRLPNPSSFPTLSNSPKGKLQSLPPQRVVETDKPVAQADLGPFGVQDKQLQQHHFRRKPVCSAVIHPQPKRLQRNHQPTVWDDTLTPFLPASARESMRRLNEMHDRQLRGGEPVHEQAGELLHLVLAATERGLTCGRTQGEEDEPCTTAERLARENIVKWFKKDTGNSEQIAQMKPTINYPLAEKNPIQLEQFDRDFFKSFQRLVVGWVGPDTVEGGDEDMLTSLVKEAMKDILLDPKVLKSIKSRVAERLDAMT